MSNVAKKKLKIAMIAPPWLSLYPGCFYGIENVVHHLTENLTRKGHHVELFTVGGTTTKASKIHWYHEMDQYRHIHRPYYEVISISISHLLYSLNVIREAGDFDIIHDHNSFIGPATLAYAADLPPILHTLHEPFTDQRKLSRGIPDNRLMYEQFKSIKNLYFNAISEKQKSMAPVGLLPRIKGVIYNGIDPAEYPFKTNKEAYFTIVASMSPDKGQAVAARACSELGLPLKMAGTIGGNINTKQEMERELSDSNSQLLSDSYFSYFKDEVAQYLAPGQIEYIGKVTDKRKKELFSKAKAFMFPVNWEEPFGIAVIEALASGTPVIAYRKGAMPEIIQHGVNGFLADSYEEFKQYMTRVDEISPEACRQSVERHFSTKMMADKYVSLYYRVIAEHHALISKGQLFKNLRHVLPLPVVRKFYALTPAQAPYPRHQTL